ncbi:NitT/TauT family transport system permease protein [Enhydrobacter aerosaccus]|uniref:NitT/TauT family transport system permease protein n=1 Tax=Enhydrobacter aerosaccus TaxID=225324 RepID=A0A1T4T3M3_9HYPH|nr:ABC transporter permease subunit [Enhydrobacter aerosaccus]SKA34997.1 NitT/TauT family transport system permease protein [Enhydrobacter aerosaccus]
MSRFTRATDLAVFTIVILALWQCLYDYAGEVAITAPMATFRNAGDLLVKPEFWPNVGATMLAFAYAFAISAVAGVALGVLLGVRRFAGEVAEPILAAIYTIPKVTLYPVMLLAFGLGMSAKVAFGVIHGVIPIVLFTMSAVKNLSPTLLRTVRVMRLTGWQAASTVIVPAILPEVISGLRVGFSLTLLGVLIGEMFASQRGLGFLIINGINGHNVRMMTAVTLIVVLFAVTANSLLLALDRHIHHHR